jgi:hypothetical protein
MRVLVVVCLMGCAFAQMPQKAPPLEAPEAHISRRDTWSNWRQRLEMPSRSNPNISRGNIPTLTLPPLDVQRVRRERDLRSGGTLDNSSPRRPQRRAREIGINRDIGVRSIDGTWVSTASGRTWMIEVSSPAALETRVHFRDFHLPPGTKLFVGAPTEDESTRAYEGEGPSGRGEFWSQIIRGDTVRLELLDANGAVEASGVLPFTVTSVGHVYDGVFGTSASCELDFMCYPDYASEGDSVARIEFSDPQYIYVCSAVLMNNLSGDFSPLLLTAHHCISSDALARTVQVYWKYQNFACNASGPSGDGISNPTTLLATTLDDTDASLLEILDAVYSTRTWAGWSTTDPTVGSAVVGIHHPHGDPKKISFGKRTNDTDPPRYSVNWDSGLMEAGSSGSPLFNSNKQVVGQLYGGYSTCSVSGPDEYGKLSFSYGQLTGPNGWNYLQKGLPDDQYAPNQTRDTAAAVTFPFSGTGLILKMNADDWFNVPVTPGQTVVVGPIYNSTYGWGGIELFRTNDVSPVARATGSSDQRLTYTNYDSGLSSLYIHTFLQSGVRVPYSLTVAPLSPPTVQTFGPQWGVGFGVIFVAGNCTSDTPPTGQWVEYTTDDASANWTRISYNGGVIPLVSLTPSTTYYYRLVCSNAAGTTTGNVQTATTKAFPVPVISAPVAGSRGVPSVLMASAGGSTFDIYFGTDPNPPLTFPNAPITGPYSLPTYSSTDIRFALDRSLLIVGTHYYWKMVAYYQGLSAASSVADFYVELASVQPNPIVFPPVLAGTTRTISTTVSNNVYYNAYLPLSFAIAGDGFNAMHAPAGCTYVCTVPITFHPAVSGTYTASLAISSSAVSGTTYVPVSGSAFDMALTRPARPARPAGSDTMTAGQSSTIAFSLSTSNVPGNVALTCEVIPAMADCVLDRDSVGGSGNWNVEVNLRTRRRLHAKARGKFEADTVDEPGTPPGIYMVRVTALFAGATRSLDCPIAVR